MDKRKFQYEGLKWLFEMDLLDHPQAINTIKLNILSTSKRIKEVELLIYREKKAMLVYVELSWFGRKFQQRQIISDVYEVISQLLPSFRVRVTEDPTIMRMAVEKVKKAITGGNHENLNHTRDDAHESRTELSDGATARPDAETTAANPEADKEEPPKA
jgi:hypothetical protein